MVKDRQGEKKKDTSKESRPSSSIKMGLAGWWREYRGLISLLCSAGLVQSWEACRVCTGQADCTLLHHEVWVGYKLQLPVNFYAIWSRVKCTVLSFLAHISPVSDSNPAYWLFIQFKKSCSIWRLLVSTSPVCWGARVCQHSHGSLLASAAMSRLVQMKAIPPVLLLAPLHQTSALVQPASQTRRRGLKLGPGRVEHSHWSRSFEILRSHWLLLRQISDAIQTQLKLKLNSSLLEALCLYGIRELA